MVQRNGLSWVLISKQSRILSISIKIILLKNGQIFAFYAGNAAAVTVGLGIALSGGMFVGFAVIVGSCIVARLRNLYKLGHAVNAGNEKGFHQLQKVFCSVAFSPWVLRSALSPLLGWVGWGLTLVGTASILLLAVLNDGPELLMAMKATPKPVEYIGEGDVKRSFYHKLFIPFSCY